MASPTRREFRFPALDGLRALAVAAVIVFHVGADLAPGGFVGVDVFFVLSGFLITGLLLGESDANGRIDLTAFYARRALRLYPALIIAVVLAGALSIAVLGTSRGLTAGSLMSLTYVTDLFIPFFDPGLLGHTWSLGVEEQFYVLWPVILIALLKRHRAADLGRVFAVIAVVLGILTSVLWPLQGRDLYFMPWTHFTELVVGAGVACLWSANRLRVPSWVAWPALLVLGVAVFAISGPFSSVLYVGGWLGLALCSAALIAVLTTQPTHLVTRGLALAPVRWIGQRSYGIYLYSAPITVAVEHHDFGRVSLNAVVTIGCTFALAAVSYRFVEQPFLRLKNRLERPYAERRG